METSKIKSFRFQDFELDPVKRVLTRDGRPVALNPKAFDLLHALVASRGEIVTKDDLLEQVWPGQFVEEANLKVHISALRKAFGEGVGDHRFIVTVPGRGYSFVADLDDQPDAEIVVESHSYADILVEETETNHQHVADALDGSVSYRRWIVLAASVLLVAITGTAVYWTALREPAAANSTRSVAVMPFVNETGDGDLEYLSDGMTEGLIGRLSRLPELSVKARTSIARYKGKEMDLRRVGEELGVEAILTGRVVRHADSVTLYAELVDPVTEKVLWKNSYDRALSDLTTLEAAVARDVAKKLKARLSPQDQARLQRGETSNAEAYELQLRGAQFSRQGSTPEEMTKSIDCFERAIALDPNYSAAYIGLAYAYIRYATTHGYRPAHDTYPKAREALLKALEIDEESPNAHSGLALYYLNYEWNWPAAERELKRSVELDSEDPGIFLDYGTYYDTLGRTDDAIRMRENARRLVPAAGVMLAGLGHSNFYGRRYDEAIKWYSAALELNPRSPWAYHNRGRSYLQIGRIAEGIADVEMAAELFDRSPRSLAALANCYGKAGKSDEARRILAELEQRATSEYVAPFYFALVYAGLNDRDQAFEYLEKAREDRQPQLTMLKVEPSFDRIRSDPRFAELVRKVGIPE